MESFPDGVWFVDLAPIAEAARVAEVACQALGIVDEPGQTPIESLTHHVGDRRMLFVIDNCEEVLDGAAGLALALLNACPAARILATSREALGLEGEAVFPVPTLEIPAAGDSSPDQLSGREAVRLFVERARAAQPDFEITLANAAAVAEICRRLDGIPLAIELAAARIRMLGVPEIRARLDDRFRLLARTVRRAPPRQQTVHAVIQWSWDHLLAPEQDLMRRLAVFTGGWTLERAAAVCSDRRDEFEVLDLLTRLEARSLVVVQRQDAGAPRYRFLESVWRFALEKLEAHADHEIVRERHLAVYLELAEESERVMNGPGQAVRLAEIAPEEENLLAAIAWSARAGDGVRRGLRLAEAVSRFWSLVGRYALACRALEDALSREGAGTPGPERALALLRVAGFRLVMGQHEAARPYLEECLAYHRTQGSRKGMAANLAGLGVVAMFQSSFEDALAYGEESLAIYREIGERRGAAMALHNLGTIECFLSRPDHGRVHFESALELLRESGDGSTEALCLSALASALVRLGDIDGARRRLGECLARIRNLDAPREKVFALESLAELALALGHPADAARFMGSAGTARRRLGLPRIPAEKAEIERFMARLAGILGPGAVEQAREAGRELLPDRVLAEAGPLLGLDPGPPGAARS